MHFDGEATQKKKDILNDLSDAQHGNGCIAADKGARNTETGSEKLLMGEEWHKVVCKAGLTSMDILILYTSGRWNIPPRIANNNQKYFAFSFVQWYRARRNIEGK